MFDCLNTSLSLTSPSSDDILLSKIHQILSTNPTSEQILSLIKTETSSLLNQISSLSTELTELQTNQYNITSPLEEELLSTKMQIKTLEDKISTLQNEKAIIKQTYETQIDDLKKTYTLNLGNAINSKNKNQTELHLKEEEILLMKLNKEKIDNLHQQNISHLNKEIQQWKDKYAQLQNEMKEKEQIYNDELILLQTQNECLKCVHNKNKEHLNIKEFYKLKDEQYFDEYKSLIKIISQNEVKIKELQTQNNEMKIYRDIIEHSSLFTCLQCNEIFNFHSMKLHIKNSECYCKYFTPQKHKSHKTYDITIQADHMSVEEIEYIVYVECEGLSWIVRKRYMQFIELYKELKHMFKGIVNIKRIGVDMKNNSLNESLVYTDQSAELNEFINDIAENKVVAGSVPFQMFIQGNNGEGIDRGKYTDIKRKFY